jgi:hypothetical protein
MDNSSYPRDARESVPSDDCPTEIVLERYLAGDATGPERATVQHWLRGQPRRVIQLFAISHAIQYPVEGWHDDGSAFEQRVMQAIRADATMPSSAIASVMGADGRTMRWRGAVWWAGVIFIALFAVLGHAYTQMAAHRVPARIYSMKYDAPNSGVSSDRASVAVPGALNVPVPTLLPPSPTIAAVEPSVRTPKASRAKTAPRRALYAPLSISSELDTALETEAPIVFEGEIVFDPSPFGRNRRNATGCCCCLSSAGSEPSVSSFGPA